MNAPVPRGVRWASKGWVPLLIAITLVIAVGVLSQRLVAPDTGPVIAPATGAAPAAATPIDLPFVPGRRSIPLVLAIVPARRDTTPSVAIPQNVFQDLAIQIDVSDEPPFAGFDARVSASDGREIWKTGETSPIKAGADGILRITVPLSTGIGEPGSYELTLAGRGEAGEPRHLGVIPFVVRRP